MYRDEEIERLNNIIKQAKKLINYNYKQNLDHDDVDYIGPYIYKDLLSIFEGNDEISIIEEDNKIEKLDIRNEKNCKNSWKWKVYGEEHGYNISTPQKIIADKINEIIDYINRGN